MIRFAVEVTGIEAAIRAFDTDHERRARVAALNKVAAKGRTQLNRVIRNEYTVKARDVNAAVTVRKASARDPRAALLARGGPLPLDRFSVKQGARTGTRVEVRKGQRKVVRRGFRAPVGSGKLSVFRRFGAARLPIERLYGPSIAQMADNTDARAAVNRVVGDQFPTEYARAYERFQPKPRQARR